MNTDQKERYLEQNFGVEPSEMEEEVEQEEEMGLIEELELNNN